jgi:hypothetical protein
MPERRSMRFEIMMNNKPSEVKVNGKTVKIKAEKGKFAENKTTSVYDDKWLYVNFTWDGKPALIEIIN